MTPSGPIISLLKWSTLSIMAAKSYLIFCAAGHLHDFLPKRGFIHHSIWKYGTYRDSLNGLNIDGGD